MGDDVGRTDSRSNLGVDTLAWIGSDWMLNLEDFIGITNCGSSEENRNGF